MTSNTFVCTVRIVSFVSFYFAVKFKMALSSLVVYIIVTSSVLVRSTSAIELLPFGAAKPNEQSIVVEDNDKVTVPLDVDLPFFGTTYNTVYVSDSYVAIGSLLAFTFQSALLLARRQMHKPGRVAQSVGHLTRKSGVLGSIPGLATYFRFSFRFFKKGSCQLLAKVCARSTG